MKRIFFVLCILSYPIVCFSTTAPDLKNRIKIDGKTDEYTSDEWILTGETAFRERSDDSRWGGDNEISGIALTWDHDYLYVAVTCATYGSVLMVFVDHAAGGIQDLQGAATLRRDVVFTGLAPNLIINADRASPEAGVVVVSSTEPLRYLERDDYDSKFFQPSDGGGALEIALPWALVQTEGGNIKLLAIVTRGEGSGAGDAAPDPSSVLEDRAYLDNAITIPVDGDLDGLVDMDVSPQGVASFAFSGAEPGREGQTFDVRLNAKLFVPDRSEVLTFRIEPGDLSGAIQLYMTCEIFSIDGKRVAVLFKDEPRTYQPRVSSQLDQWNGRNTAGDVVPGGIYVVNVSGGVARGARTHVSRKPVAVAR